MEEERLDKLIMQRKLVSSRVRAEKIIHESGVLVNGKLFNKPGKKVPVDAEIVLLEEEIPWVSRGALKLLRAIENWQLDFTGKTVLDIGASTGGFTEVALHHGAARVYALDVGSKQLHPKLSSDTRVVNLEKMHVREISTKNVPDIIDICVIDVSFISLAKIFPFFHTFLRGDASVVALVKPQFEVGKEHIEKGGIVKNKSLYPKVIEDIKQEARRNNLSYVSHIESPILGGDGNMEFLLLLRKNLDLSI
ncbi:MAG: TlyA family RNA methyltransferase [Bacteroidota bacterium]